MFIIDFRNKLVSNYSFSVIGNNNVDTVYLFSHFTQYVSGYNVYLKVISEDNTYLDKIEIDNQNISLEDGALLVKWTMGLISTQCKKIDIQLQFENSDGSLIAQTRIVSITLADTIDIDGEIGHIYPKILTQLQEQIDELKHDSVVDFTMSYANDTLIINFKNKNNEVVATHQIAIPTSNSFISVSSLDNNVITFSDRAGNTYPLDLSGLVSGKLDKTSNANVIYGTDGQGEQQQISVDNGTNVSGSIARRDSSGQLSVPQTPNADTDAVSKKYVDTIIQSVKRDAYKTVDITDYPTLQDFLATTGEEGYMYLYPVDPSESPDFASGYYRYIWEENKWVDLGDSNIDLSNYYTKNESENKFVDFSTEQSVSGVKKFTNGIKFSNDANFGFALYQSGSNLYFKVGNSIKWVLSFAGQFQPYNNQSSNGTLGGTSLSNHWQSIYVNYIIGEDGKPVYTDKIRKKIFNVKSTVNTTTLSYLVFFETSRNADTTFTLQALDGHENGCYPEYKGSITNSHGTDPIVLTFTGVNHILTNDPTNVAVNSNTITLTAGTTFEYSILNGNMVAVNFAV